MKYLGINIFLLFGFSLLLYSCGGKMNQKQKTEEQTEGKSIHSLSAKSLLEEKEVSLSDYKGKVMLIVNTASKCGLTPQYAELQGLHENYSSKGLAILGFPSNDFMKQEPGSAEQIADFCEKNYGVQFDMFEKVRVKGDQKHPIYQFLTEKSKNGVLDSSVSWNFQKYLLDKDGKLIEVFNPRVKVTNQEVVSKIEELLSK